MVANCYWTLRNPPRNSAIDWLRACRTSFTLPRFNYTELCVTSWNTPFRTCVFFKAVAMVTAYFSRLPSTQASRISHDTFPELGSPSMPTPPQTWTVPSSVPSPQTLEVICFSHWLPHSTLNIYLNGRTSHRRKQSYKLWFVMVSLYSLLWRDQK